MKKAKIYYYRAENCKNKQEKLSLLNNLTFKELDFEHIIPDKNNNWINQTDNDFETLIPVCDKQTKLGKNQHAIFKLFSLGIVTARDEWVYDFNKNNLKEKVQFFIETYNKEIERWLQSDKSFKINDFVNRSIKWTSELEEHLLKNHSLEFNSSRIIPLFYRPFIKKLSYFERIITHRIYQNEIIFGKEGLYQNSCIVFSDTAFRSAFSSIVVDRIPEYHFAASTDGFQCLPFYIYDKEGNPQENITNWALELFQNHYNNQEITKEQIFNYVYAVLHDPKYRQKYEQNLKREFPRIPFYENFEQWTKLGKELIELHLNYETVEKYPLQRIDTNNAKIPKPKLKADKTKGTIQLDDNTRLENVPKEAWEYLLGNRSALEWVLDQYKEKTPKDATIAQNFNTYKFADHKEHVIDLLCRVCKVSVETVRIVQSLKNLSPIDD